jgi:hypothetical protein
MENLDAESIATLIKGGATALSVALGSKPAAVFIEKVSGMVGWAIEPTTIKRRARAEAAASIIKAEADQEVKAIGERVVARIAHEENRYQTNMEAVVLTALPNITVDAKPEELDDDWLASFFSKCRQVSNEDMQKLWSQLLAQEANEPGSFSIRTLNALATLSKEEAILFKDFSTFFWLYKGGQPIAIATHDMLSGKVPYNLSSNTVFHLDDLGFCNYNNVKEYTITEKDLYLVYNGRRFNLHRLNERGEKLPKLDSLPVGYMILTQIGRELANICIPTPNLDYMNDVIKSWELEGILVEEVVVNNN